MKGFKLVGLFFGWLTLSLVASCRKNPLPSPLPTPVPTIEMLTIGVADSAMELADLVGDNYDQKASHTGLRFVWGNDEVLRSNLEEGVFDAILVHHVEENTTTWFNPVAVDGLVLIVHPDNPITDLTLTEAKAIFNGQLSNWAELGGPDRPIKPIVREDGSGVNTIFLDRIMTGQQAYVDAQVAPSDEIIQEIVNSQFGYIGYSMMGNTNEASAIRLNGKTATPSTTADQSYPLAAPVYFVTLVEPEGNLRAFLAWLQSPEGQSIVGDSYGRVR